MLKMLNVKNNKMLNLKCYMIKIKVLDHAKTSFGNPLNSC